MCEQKCTDDFSGWGQYNHILRDGECSNQDCPICINNICEEGSFSDWLKNQLVREERGDLYCPARAPVYCSWEDGYAGCIAEHHKCDEFGKKERRNTKECVLFKRYKGFGQKCSAQSKRERESRPEKIILSQREEERKRWPCVCFWQASDNSYILGGQEQSSELWHTRQYGAATELTKPEKMISMDKNTIIDNHKKILESFKTDKGEYYKELKISRYDLYISYVKCLQGSKNDLKTIIDAFSKWSQVDDTLNVPGWWKNPRFFCNDIVSSLENKLFGNNRLPNIKELSSIDNVGPNKAIGYVQHIILTPDYIEKYKGNEYMITCVSTSGECDCTTGEGLCNVYIIHKPTVKNFIDLNPNIFQTIPVKCSCDSENQRNIEDGIYDIVKYYMMNWRHESPPVPVPSYLEDADREALDVKSAKIRQLAFALFGSDSQSLRNNIKYPYEFEDERNEGLPTSKTVPVRSV